MGAKASEKKPSFFGGESLWFCIDRVLVVNGEIRAFAEYFGAGGDNGGHWLSNRRNILIRLPPAA